MSVVRHPAAMPARTHRTSIATARAQADLATAAQELRAARIELGLSQADVGRAVRLSDAQVSRIERGLAPTVGLATLGRIGAVVGMEVRLRAFPSGSPLRDRAHLDLLERLRRSIHPALRWRTEVPLPIRGDRRAWDATISTRSWTVGVEAETRPTDVQALLRRLNLKQRDAGIDLVILLLAATRHNRALIRSLDETLRAAFPVPGPAALDRLAVGQPPGGGAIVVM
jgi:transcriptional regulator with XRE-family HTH domain